MSAHNAFVKKTLNDFAKIADIKTDDSETEMTKFQDICPLFSQSIYEVCRGSSGFSLM